MDLELITSLEVLPEKFVFLRSGWLDGWTREKRCSCGQAASLEPHTGPVPLPPLLLGLPLKRATRDWQLLLFQVATPGKNKIKYPSSSDSLISMYVEMHQPNEAMPLQQTAGLSIVEASEYQKNFEGKETLLVKHK